MSLFDDDSGLAEFEENLMLEAGSRSAVLRKLAGLSEADRAAAVAESYRTSRRSEGPAKLKPLGKRRVAEIRDQTPESIRAEAKAKLEAAHRAVEARHRNYRLAEAKRARQARHGAKLTTYGLRQRREASLKARLGWE